MSKASEDVEESIVINGKVINNLRYSNDTVLVADSIDDLQKILNNIITARKNLRINLSSRKIKYMIIYKTLIPSNVLRLKNIPLEKITQNDLRRTIIIT